MPKSKLSLGQTKTTDASTVVAATKSATKIVYIPWKISTRRLEKFSFNLTG